MSRASHGPASLLAPNWQERRAIVVQPSFPFAVSGPVLSRWMAHPRLYRVPAADSSKICPFPALLVCPNFRFAAFVIETFPIASLVFG